MAGRRQWTKSSTKLRRRCFGTALSLWNRPQRPGEHHLQGPSEHVEHLPWEGRWWFWQLGPAQLSGHGGVVPGPRHRCPSCWLGVPPRYHDRVVGEQRHQAPHALGQVFRSPLESPGVPFESLESPRSEKVDGDTFDCHVKTCCDGARKQSATMCLL